nr:WG repeat-containing protein [Haliscomenobacter sp.]
MLPCNYEEIGYLKEEKDWIRVKQNGKWGWVDKKGKVMIPIRYDAIAPFEDGKAPVIQLPYEDHFFINYQGEFLLESLRKREEE